MKGGTVQINWHETKPVLTLDFHPLSGLLCTGGADFDIKVCLLSFLRPPFQTTLCSEDLFFIFIFCALDFGTESGYWFSVVLIKK